MHIRSDLTDNFRLFWWRPVKLAGWSGELLTLSADIFQFIGLSVQICGTMKFVTLPNTDIKVSPICLGTWQFNNSFQTKDKTWDPMTEQVSETFHLLNCFIKIKS